MSAREPLFDVVRAIQDAEREALDSLGARTVVEARERRRAAAKDRQDKRWHYVQRRANAGLTGPLTPVTQAEASKAMVLSNHSLPDPDPIEEQGYLRKLLKW